MLFIFNKLYYIELTLRYASPSGYLFLMAAAEDQRQGANGQKDCHRVFYMFHIRFFCLLIIMLKKYRITLSNW